jgi:hypothetical protein
MSALRVRRRELKIRFCHEKKKVHHFTPRLTALPPHPVGRSRISDLAGGEGAFALADPCIA